MSENTTENVVEVPNYGPVTLKPLPEAVEGHLQELGKKARLRVARAIQVLTALTNEHNLNCSTVKRAADDNKDPQSALENIRVSNPHNDPELEKLNKRIEQLMTQVDKAKADAHKISEKYLTAAVSTEEAEVKRKKTQESSKVIRELRKNLETIAQVVDEDIDLEGGIMSLIPDPDSLRGVKLSGGESSGEGTAKLRTDKIYLNGETIEKKFETPQGDKYKTSFSILAAKLNQNFSAHKDPANKVTALDLTNAMYDHLGITRGTKQADIKQNEINFPFTKTVNYTKNGEVTPVEEKMSIRVIFNYDEALKANAEAAKTEELMENADKVEQNA